MPRQYQPAAPFVAPVAGTMEARLAQVAGAINGKADRTTRPSFDTITLRAPDGSVWELGVSTTGTLTVAQVTP